MTSSYVQGAKRGIVTAVAAIVIMMGALDAQAIMIYDSFNAAGVSNGPTVDTLFSLNATTSITSIVNYHWNNGLGVDPAGNWIGIEQILSPTSVVSIGQWAVVASQGAWWGSATTIWTASPNITLGAGDYRITDSSPATWSYASGAYGGDGPNWAPNQGFTQIYAADAAPVPEPSTLFLLCGGIAGLVALRKKNRI